jgi:hypothetical protein
MTPSRIPAFVALAALVGSLTLGAAFGASAGPPGRWTQITHAHNGARSNLGLARAKDGRLHVLWAGPNRAPFPAIYDSTITLAGVVAKPQPVLSSWLGVNSPTAATAPDGSIHAVISGSKTSSATDPYSGLNEAVGPGSWKIEPRAFGNASITVASNADVHSAFLKSGQLVSVWQTAAALLFQVGVDPSAQPQNITPKGLAVNPVLAVDAASGDAIVAYHNVTEGVNYFLRIQPGVGAPQAIPQSKSDGPSITARAGGGVYSAYSPDGTKVVLLRHGGASKSVPVPRGARVLAAGVAAGPDGRLWVFYGNEQQTYVTRTSKAVGGFEPVQTLKSPAKTVQFFRLEGEGSAGPLDLFADVTIDGQAKDGSYHQQVWPVLSLGASKKATGKRVQVTVRVSDAGDAVAGAKVAGLPVGTKTTDAKGSVVFTVPASRHGSFALKATKAGYHPAKTTLSL